MTKLEGTLEVFLTSRVPLIFCMPLFKETDLLKRCDIDDQFSGRYEVEDLILARLF